MASDITIFHNPDCGTSRNVLALIRHAGLEPEVIEYLKTPPTKARLRELLAAMELPGAILREKGTPYAELDLANAKERRQLLDFIGSPDPHEPPDRGDAAGDQALQAFGRSAETCRWGRCRPHKSDGEQVVDHGHRRRTR